MKTNADIIEYYDIAEISYKDVWHLDTCLSMHYGFWGKDVPNLKSAIIKQIEVLAHIAKINSADVVLDAGCGYGGSAIYLAKNFNCNVYGITLSEKQVQRACTEAQKSGVAHLVDFSKRDFHHSNFPNEMFSVIWFIESICYSNHIYALAKELFRLLKPNGRIIIADGFATSRVFTGNDKIIMGNWLPNWAINRIETTDEILKALTSAGFTAIQATDYTAQISKSSYKLYIYANLALFIGKLKKLIGKTYGSKVTINNTIGAKYQYIALKKKLWRYYVITAQK